MDQRFSERFDFDVDQLGQQELANLISGCHYCERVDFSAGNTPVLCTKFSGSRQPIRVNFNTCIACREFA